MNKLKYAWLTLKHKWFVLRAGRKFRVPLWRLIKHDWTKFMPSELPHYGRQFFGDSSQPSKFDICWLRHQNRHEHHWEYWVTRSGHALPERTSGFLEMSKVAVREMVADWYAACRAYEGHWPVPNEWDWLDKNLKQIREVMIGSYAWLYLVRILAEQGHIGPEIEKKETEAWYIDR